MVGLVAYGSYIPYHWLIIDEVARAWGTDDVRMAKTLGVKIEELVQSK